MHGSRSTLFHRNRDHVVDYRRMNAARLGDEVLETWQLGPA